RPALQPAHRAALHNGHHIAHVRRALLVVRVELLALGDDSLVNRMRHPARHFDNDGLRHLVRHYVADLVIFNVLFRVRHRYPLLAFFAGAFFAAGVFFSAAGFLASGFAAAFFFGAALAFWTFVSTFLGAAAAGFISRSRSTVSIRARSFLIER